MRISLLRRIGFGLAILTAGLLIPTLIIAQNIPPIPHSLDGRADCLVCHETGIAGAPQIPENHAGRTNQMCQACHKPAEEIPAAETGTPEGTSEATEATRSPTPEETTEATEATRSPTPEETTEATEATRSPTPEETTEAADTATPEETKEVAESPTPEGTIEATAAPEPPIPGGTPTDSGPLPVPHTLVGRENCLACHTSEAAPLSAEEEVTEGPDIPLIPHTLVGRENCLACHEEGVGGAPQIPADHAGRTNDICQACHQPSELPAEPTPTTPAEPIPTPIIYPEAEGVNTCFDCHATLEGRHVDITTQWQRSAHAERDVACADCHGGDPSAETIDEAMDPEAGYIGVPAKEEIPALCASCHADVSQMRQYDLPTDQYAKYQESIHGIRLAEGDPNVATCYDCHGGHQILKANDPASTVYPVNVPAMCASCHADEALMAPYNIPTNQYDLYRQSVHGHALLDNQDFRAPTCAVCHGTHGAAPPGFQEVANVCGSCHGATQDHFLKSPHAKAGESGPKCVTCHGRYDVSEPTEALYLGSEPRHCGSCHNPDSPGGQVAQSLYTNITTAAGAYEGAILAVEEARDLGMLVTPLEGRLREANTDLITARAVQHTLDVTLVSDQVDSAEAMANEVTAGAEAAVAESIFRRQAMIIAIAVIGLTIVALYLLKRELDKRLEAKS